MAGALQNAPPLTYSNQLDTVEVLQTLFEKWRLLEPPSLLKENRGRALHPTCASPAPTQPRHWIEPTILFMPLNRMTAKLTHLVPPHGCHPHYRHWCHKPQSNMHMSPHSKRPRPRGSSLMTLLPQVCPEVPHNCP
jgi:hypothetical protein